MAAVTTTATSAAILIGGAAPDSQRLPFTTRIPRHLLSVADKPWLQHIVEALRDAGALRIYCFDALAPERTRELLADGTRWGCTITHHAVADPTCPCGVLGRVDLGEGPVWVVDSTDWPALDSADTAAPLRLVTRAGTAVGWALLDAATRRRIPATLPVCAWAAWLEREVPTVRCSRSVHQLRDGTSLIEAQRDVLEGRHPAHIDATPAEPGVWVSRNVRIHPAARVRPPVLLAADSWLQADSCTGPNAVIGAGAVVGAHSIVSDAWLGRATVLGEGLELRRGCAWSSRIWNADVAEELHIADGHLLTSLHVPGVAEVTLSVVARLAAAALLLACLPVLAPFALFQRLRRGRLRYAMRMARLPAPDYPERRSESLLSVWHEHPSHLRGIGHLLAWTLPGLWHVMFGRLRWVGIAPRSWETMQAVPDELRAVIIEAHCGLIDEAWVRYGPCSADCPDVEERVWADAYQTVQRQRGYALRLIASYVRCVCGGRHASAAGSVSNPPTS